MTDELVPVEDLPLWVNAPMRCVVCGWEWIAMYCIEASHLKCRECGHMNEAPLLPKEN